MVCPLLSLVPTARSVYSAYGGLPQQVLAVPALLAWPLLGCLIVRSTFAHSRNREITIVLFTITSALVCAYLLQFKGWFYHRLPIYTGLCLTLAWLAITGARPVSQDRFARVLLYVFLVGFAVFPVLHGPYQNPSVAAFSPYFPSSRADRSFLALTAHVWVSFPLANIYNAQVTSRYPALWLIPGAVAQLGGDANLSSSRRKALQNVLVDARRSTTKDFLSGRPEIVFVHVSNKKSYFGGVTFDYLRFFNRDPRFAAAWSNYHRVATVGEFEVWKRAHQ